MLRHVYGFVGLRHVVGGVGMKVAGVVGLHLRRGSASVWLVFRFGLGVSATCYANVAMFGSCW